MTGMRAAGAILVIFGAAGLGAFFAGHFLGRLRELEELRRLMYLMKGEILFAGASLDEVITAALEAAKAGVEATKDMVPVFGKAAVHAAASVGVPDQGATAGYYKILGLYRYITK